MTKFWQWYDSLEEPWRMFLFLGLTLPPMAGLTTGESWAKLLSVFWLVFLTITRIQWEWRKGGKNAV